MTVLALIWTEEAEVFSDKELAELEKHILNIQPSKNENRTFWTCQSIVVDLFRALVHEKKLSQFDRVVFVADNQIYEIDSNGRFETYPSVLTVLDKILSRLIV